MNIKEDTAKDPEGNQEHVIGNWRNGILVINWQKKKKKLAEWCPTVMWKAELISNQTDI